MAKKVKEKELDMSIIENQKIVDIELNNEMKSGTAQTVRYAKRMGLTIVNVSKKSFDAE